jgi:DNA polymerase IV
MGKVIVHIDLNAFFARAEEIRNPSLEGKPVAIGHDGRSGIVSTCSYAARKFGVHSGMPMFMAKELCPDLIIKHGDYRYYSGLSRLFFKFVKRYTPLVEIASVDECFADFTEVVKKVDDVPAFFRKMQNDLFLKTQLKCSIGVATTKFLAKMGSDYQKPMGLTFIRKRDIPAILYPLEIEKMYGIGKKTAPRLRSIGIKTIGDLAIRCEKNDPDLINIMGKFYTVIKDWINGRGSDVIVSEPEEQKSIGNSSTFYHDTNDFNEIKYMFEQLAKEVSSRAIKENKMGSTIQIVVKEANFIVHNKSLTFDNPTNDYKQILDIALKLYEKNFLSMTVRLVGITLQNLIDPRDMAIQISLFDYEKAEEDNRTRLLINELNRRLKKDSLMRASEVGTKEKK